MDLKIVIGHPWAFGLLTLSFLVLTIEAGYRTAKYINIEKDGSREKELEAIRDGLFLLVSLLLGFTLAVAAPQYLERRSLLVDEANAIGTTYLRTAVLPQPQRDQSQQLLALYVDARLDFDRANWNEVRTAAAMENSKKIQTQLWQNLIEATKNERSAITASYMVSLNELIDIHEKRLSALENRIPRAIWLLDLCVAALAVFLRGLTTARHFWFTVLVVPLTIAVVLALIADLDTPGRGLIRVDQGAMLRLKADMNGVSSAQPAK